MVIDFHTHIFPDKIAHKTIELLKENSKIPAYTDGTLSGLQASMKKAGVDYSVLLPVATKPQQTESINNFAIEAINQGGIISFGGIHPLYEDYKTELKRIKNSGLKGIKLHPDYQKFYVDDEKVYPFISFAAELGLIIVFHSGLDLGVKGETRCTPERARKMIKAIGSSKMVFAHTGGYNFWDSVMDNLVGEDIYFDTSFSLGQIDDDKFLKIVRTHGADKLLFATDSPWGGQQEDLAYIKSIGLSNDELELILHKNAEKLLNM